eukprot:356126-Chlamydomonas_euryale.AAC.8
MQGSDTASGSRPAGNRNQSGARVGTIIRIPPYLLSSLKRYQDCSKVGSTALRPVLLQSAPFPHAQKHVWAAVIYQTSRCCLAAGNRTDSETNEEDFVAMLTGIRRCWLLRGCTAAHCTTAPAVAVWLERRCCGRTDSARVLHGPVAAQKTSVYECEPVAPSMTCQVGAMPNGCTLILRPFAHLPLSEMMAGAVPHGCTLMLRPFRPCASFRDVGDAEVLQRSWLFATHCQLPVSQALDLQIIL